MNITPVEAALAVTVIGGVTGFCGMFVGHVLAIRATTNEAVAHGAIVIEGVKYTLVKTGPGGLGRRAMAAAHAMQAMIERYGVDEVECTKGNNLYSNAVEHADRLCTQLDADQ